MLSATYTTPLDEMVTPLNKRTGNLKTQADFIFHHKYVIIIIIIKNINI